MLRTPKMKSQLILSIILIHGTFGANLKKSEEDSSEITSTLIPTTTEETKNIKLASGSEISPSILPHPSPSEATPQLSSTSASEISNIKKYPNSIQDKLGTASSIGSPYGGANGIEGLSVFSRGNIQGGLGGLNPNLYAGNGFGGNFPHFNQVIQGLTPGQGVGPGLYNGPHGVNQGGFGGVNGNYPIVVQPGAGYQGEEVSVTKEAGVSPLGGVKVSNSVNVNSVGVSGPYVDSPQNLYHGYQGVSHHHKAGIGGVGQGILGGVQGGNNVPVHHHQQYQGLGNNLHSHIGGGGSQILNSPYVGIGHNAGQGNFGHPQQLHHGQGNFIHQQQLGYPQPGFQQGAHGLGNGLAHELGRGVGGFGQNGINGGIYTMNPNLYNQLLDPIYYQKFALQNQNHHLNPHQGNVQGSYLQQRFPGARSPYQNQFLQSQQQQYQPHIHHPVNPFSNPFTSPYDLRTTGANRFYTGKNPSGAFRHHKFDSEKEDY